MKMRYLQALVIFAVSYINADVINISSLSQLQDIIAKNDFVVVKFYSDSCGPCRGFAPIYKAAAGDATFKSIVFVEVNAAYNQSIAAHYTIKSIPALHFYKNGQLKLAESGSKTSSQFRALLNVYFPQ